MAIKHQSATIHTISRFLDQLLEVGKYHDMGINGLQVDASGVSGDSPVTRVAFAVDSGRSIIERAIEEQCQILVVHHGELWGQCSPLTGPWGVKVSLMMRHGLSLYAAHLPLDGHLELGHAAQVASVIGLTEVVGAFDYKGQTIGVAGRLASPTPLNKVLDTLANLEGMTSPLVLPFGARDITTVGIVTGSGTGFIGEASVRGFDLLVTGEPKQQAYHDAKDRNQSVVCIGHYASETLGLRALERVLARDFNVQTSWISEPTGI